jgi:hypothetical protein
VGETPGQTGQGLDGIRWVVLVLGVVVALVAAIAGVWLTVVGMLCTVLAMALGLWNGRRGD